MIQKNKKTMIKEKGKEICQRVLDTNYNDSSLETIFTNMLESIGVIVSGVYVDPL